MAKPLVVELRGQSFDLQLEKVDRTKLYGFIETEVLDEAGRPCETGTLTGDGHSIVGRGGSAIAYLSPDGLWRKKTELRPVDPAGQPIPPVKSTFDSVVNLDRTVSIDEYLSHNIHLIYRLTAEQEPTALMEELKQGTIFQFPFSYRGGIEASAGFLLQAADGNIFLCVGSPTKIEFIGLKTAAPIVTEETGGTDAEEEDLLDFSIV
jgi:hypothetical protein